MFTQVLAPVSQILILTNISFVSRNYFIAITMSIKNYVIVGTFLFGLSLSLPAQDSTEQSYYRTFSIELKNFDQETEQKLYNLFIPIPHFQIKDVCTEGRKILVAVEASYPKRVNDIKAELQDFISNELGKRRVLEVVSIPFAEQNSYCS